MLLSWIRSLLLMMIGLSQKLSFLKEMLSSWIRGLQLMTIAVSNFFHSKGNASVVDLRNPAYDRTLRLMIIPCPARILHSWRKFHDHELEASGAWSQHSVQESCTLGGSPIIIDSRPPAHDDLKGRSYHGLEGQLTRIACPLRILRSQSTCYRHGLEDSSWWWLHFL